MENVRKPLQGVMNIIRFNWHFYAIISAWLVLSFAFLNFFSPDTYLRFFILLMNAVIILAVCISVLVSAYIYDFSGLYRFDFLDHLKIHSDAKVANINAGFDETSEILKSKFNLSNIVMMDFYEEEKHTEVSIKRARKKYPNSPDTLKISSSKLPFDDGYFDHLFLIFSAHEIRDQKEREFFFSEIKRVCKDRGEVIIIEHLRDLPNFLAYNIGFLHFLSPDIWFKTFQAAKLKLKNHQKINPFINVFYLQKNGITP